MLAPLAIGLLVAGFGLIVTAIVLRQKQTRFTGALKVCIVLGIVAIATGGMLLAFTKVDVITKYSSGSGDDGP